MKNLRKILAIVLAVIMATAVMIGLPASAQPATTGSITINAPQSLTFEGQEVTLYRVFTVTHTIGADDANRFHYVIEPAFEGFNSGLLGELTLHQFLLWHAENLPAPDEPRPLPMERLANELWNYAQNPANNVPVIDSRTGVANQRTVTFPDLTFGYYLVAGYGVAEDGQQVWPVPTLVTLYQQELVVNLKADAPPIEKEIDNDHPEIDDWYVWNDGSIGDTVNFRLTSFVPRMIGYTRYVYTVHDRMSDGLTFNPGSVEVLVNGVEYTYFTVDYPAAPHEVGGRPCDCTFRIVFDPDEFVKLNDLYNDLDENDPPPSIVITYSATINEDAAIGPIGNENEVRLQFSNDPFDTRYYTYTPWSRVVVYTGMFGFIKVDGDRNLATLGGAEFELWTGEDAPETKVWFRELDPVLSDDGETVYMRVYRVVPEGTAGAVDVLTTPEGGRVQVQGVGTHYLYQEFDHEDNLIEEITHRDGNYWLIEIKSPENFHPRPEPIPVEFKIVNVNVEFPVGDPTTWELIFDSEDEGLEWIVLYEEGYLGILNFADQMFPETGGIGRTIFIVAGVALMGLAAVGLVITSVRKKKKAVADWTNPQ